MERIVRKLGRVDKTLVPRLDACVIDEAEEACSRLVVARGDPAAVLGPSEAALDQVAQRVDMIREADGIKHRPTIPNHPRTDGQFERMNRTIEEASVKRFHRDSRDRPRTHLGEVMAAYPFARRLETLRVLAPYDCIGKIPTSEPDRSILDPIHQMLGLNT